jgi:Predicted methyltransferase
MRRLIFAVSSLLGLITAPLPASAADPAPEAETCEGCEALLELAVANPLRKDDQPRDKYRHPVETLTFLRVGPQMKVGEYAPGGEWYSRLLGLYLGQQGHLVGLYFDPTSGPFKPEMQAGIRKSAAKYPADVAKFSGMPAEKFAAYTLDDIPEGEKGTFDRILVIRMLHNMMNWKNAQSEFAAMHALLKPGGMLGIVQHRASPDAPDAYVDGSKGYLREEDVTAFMESNGFELVDKSEINANAEDSADWPEGVWTLPPTLALKEQDREKYLAIGESDRMTLLFRKRD